MTAKLFDFKKRKNIDEEYNDLIEKLDYYNVLLLNYNFLNEQHKNHILSGISSIFGEHSKRKRDFFLSFLNNPNLDNWNLIKKQLIDGTTTSLQLWIRHRNDEEEQFPTAENFLKYLKTHKEHRIKAIKDIIKETLNKLEEYRI